MAEAALVGWITAGLAPQSSYILENRARPVQFETAIYAKMKKLSAFKSTGLPIFQKPAFIDLFFFPRFFSIELNVY